MKITTESAKSMLRVALANSIAATLVDGFQNAADNGHPLTDRQKASVTAMALMNYRDYAQNSEALADLEGKFELLRLHEVPDPIWATDSEARRERYARYVHGA